MSYVNILLYKYQKLLIFRQLINLLFLQKYKFNNVHKLKTFKCIKFRKIHQHIELYCFIISITK